MTPKELKRENEKLKNGEKQSKTYRQTLSESVHELDLAVENLKKELKKAFFEVINFFKKGEK